MTQSEFRAVFDDHKDAVYGFAYRMTGSSFDAEEASQDCFLALLRGTAKFDVQRGSMRCFLIGVTRNIILKRWRSEGRFDPIEDDDTPVDPVDPSSRETSEIVAQAVGGLPPLQREALILAEYEGFSLKEIAETVGTEKGERSKHVCTGLERTCGEHWPRWQPLKEGNNMQTFDDEKLSKLLSEWHAPQAPGSLEARLSKEKSRRWWLWFVRGRIQVPVPVAAAVLVVLVIWASSGPRLGVGPGPQPGVGLSGFQLADDLNPRIIRSTHEND